jgi:Spy/CpxP family protein refolding chaperone
MKMKTHHLFLCLVALAALIALPCFAQNPADQAAGAASQAGSAASQAAQSTTSAASDAETQAKVQQKLQHLSSELNLSDDQKTKLKPILQNQIAQAKTVNDDSSMSADAKQAKMKEIRTSTQQQMNEILTPDQQQKLAKMKAEKGGKD